MRCHEKSPARKSVTCCCHVNPSQAPYGDLKRSGQEESEEAIEPKNVLFGDRIVGDEHVTLSGQAKGRSA